VTFFGFDGFLRVLIRIAVAYGVRWVNESPQLVTAYCSGVRHIDDTQGKMETEGRQTA